MRVRASARFIFMHREQKATQGYMHIDLENTRSYLGKDREQDHCAQQWHARHKMLLCLPPAPAGFFGSRVTSEIPPPWTWRAPSQGQCSEGRQGQVKVIEEC